VSIENVKKAERLIQERARIAASKWNAVVDDTNLRERQTYSSCEATDEQLQWVIEEFRKRKLDAIDAQLRELGVDPAAEAA
jgi:hypothetical protein